MSEKQQRKEPLTSENRLKANILALDSVPSGSNLETRVLIYYVNEPSVQSVSLSELSRDLSVSDPANDFCVSSNESDRNALIQAVQEKLSALTPTRELQDAIELANYLQVLESVDLESRDRSITFPFPNGKFQKVSPATLCLTFSNPEAIDPKSSRFVSTNSETVKYLENVLGQKIKLIRYKYKEVRASAEGDEFSYYSNARRIALELRSRTPDYLEVSEGLTTVRRLADEGLVLAKESLGDLETRIKTILEQKLESRLRLVLQDIYDANLVNTKEIFSIVGEEYEKFTRVLPPILRRLTKLDAVKTKILPLTLELFTYKLNQEFYIRTASGVIDLIKALPVDFPNRIAIANSFLDRYRAFVAIRADQDPEAYAYIISKTNNELLGIKAETSPSLEQPTLEQKRSQTVAAIDALPTGSDDQVLSLYYYNSDIPLATTLRRYLKDLEVDDTTDTDFVTNNRLERARLRQIIRQKLATSETPAAVQQTQDIVPFFDAIATATPKDSLTLKFRNVAGLVTLDFEELRADLALSDALNPKSAFFVTESDGARQFLFDVTDQKILAANFLETNTGIYKRLIADFFNESTTLCRDFVVAFPVLFADAQQLFDAAENIEPTKIRNIISRVEDVRDNKFLAVAVRVDAQYLAFAFNALLAAQANRQAAIQFICAELLKEVPNITLVEAGFSIFSGMIRSSDVSGETSITKDFLTTLARKSLSLVLRGDLYRAQSQIIESDPAFLFISLDTIYGLQSARISQFNQALPIIFRDQLTDAAQKQVESFSDPFVINLVRKAFYDRPQQTIISAIKTLRSKPMLQEQLLSEYQIFLSLRGEARSQDFRNAFGTDPFPVDKALELATKLDSSLEPEPKYRIERTGRGKFNRNIQAIDTYDPSDPNKPLLIYYFGQNLPVMVELSTLKNDLLSSAPESESEEIIVGGSTVTTSNTERLMLLEAIEQRERRFLVPSSYEAIFDIPRIMDALDLVTDPEQPCIIKDKDGRNLKISLNDILFAGPGDDVDRLLSNRRVESFISSVALRRVGASNRVQELGAEIVKELDKLRKNRSSKFNLYFSGIVRQIADTLTPGSGRDYTEAVQLSRSIEVSIRNTTLIPDQDKGDLFRESKDVELFITTTYDVYKLGISIYSELSKPSLDFTAIANLIGPLRSASNISGLAIARELFEEVKVALSNKVVLLLERSLYDSAAKIFKKAPTNLPVGRELTDEYSRIIDEYQRFPFDDVVQPISINRPPLSEALEFVEQFRLNYSVQAVRTLFYTADGETVLQFLVDFRRRFPSSLYTEYAELMEEYGQFLSARKDLRPLDYEAVFLADGDGNVARRYAKRELGLDKQSLMLLRRQFSNRLLPLVETFRGQEETIETMDNVLQGEYVDEKGVTRSNRSRFLRRKSQYAQDRREQGEAPGKEFTLNESVYLNSIQKFALFNPYVYAALRAAPHESRIYAEQQLHRLSEKTKGGLKNGAYTPLIIVGAGPHGVAAYNELLRQRPTLAAQTLLIDKAKDVGGPFGYPNGPAWNLNSRSPIGDRPRMPRKPEREENTVRAAGAPLSVYPGERENVGDGGRSNSINLIFAPFLAPDEQVAEGYITNERFVDVERTHALLGVSNIALKTEILSEEVNRSVSIMGTRKVRLRVHFADGSKEDIVQYTDGVIHASGYGVPSFGLDGLEDTDSKLEAKKVIEGAEKQDVVFKKALTSLDFFDAVVRANETGDVSGLGETICIYGNGDTLNTMIEMLASIVNLYQKPELRNKIKKIFVIANTGQDNFYFADFLRMVRPRYAAIADYIDRSSEIRSLITFMNGRVGDFTEIPYDANLRQTETVKILPIDTNNRPFLKNPQSGDLLVVNNIISAAGYTLRNDSVFKSYLRDNETMGFDSEVRRPYVLPDNPDVAVGDTIRGDSDSLLVGAGATPRFNDEKLEQLPERTQTVLAGIPANKVAMGIRGQETMAAINLWLLEHPDVGMDQTALNKPQELTRRTFDSFVRNSSIVPLYKESLESSITPSNRANPELALSALIGGCLAEDEFFTADNKHYEGEITFEVTLEKTSSSGESLQIQNILLSDRPDNTLCPYDFKSSIEDLVIDPFTLGCILKLLKTKTPRTGTKLEFRLDIKRGRINPRKSSATRILGKQ